MVDFTQTMTTQAAPNAILQPKTTGVAPEYMSGKLSVAPDGRAVYDPTSSWSTLGQYTSQQSPLLTSARSRSQQAMAGRGLLNTTMAGRAGEAAAIEAASPFATTDTGYYQQKAAAEQKSNLERQQLGYTSELNAQQARLESELARQAAEEQARQSLLNQQTLMGQEAEINKAAAAEAAKQELYRQQTLMGQEAEINKAAAAEAAQRELYRQQTLMGQEAEINRQQAEFEWQQKQLAAAQEADALMARLQAQGQLNIDTANSEAIQQNKRQFANEISSLQKTYTDLQAKIMADPVYKTDTDRQAALDSAYQSHVASINNIATIYDMPLTWAIAPTTVSTSPTNNAATAGGPVYQQIGGRGEGH